MRVLVIPHLCQHLVWIFWILTLLIGRYWYRIVVLICITLMTYDMENIFICLLAIYISPLVKYLLKFLFVFLLFSLQRFFCIFWITILYQVYLLKIFSRSLWTVFSFFDIVFHRKEVYNFNEVQLINHLFHKLCLGCCTKKSSPNSRSFRFSLTF